MTKNQLIDYLKANKWDIQNANAALFACDLVFMAYAKSQIIHGIKYDPVCCYFERKAGTKPLFYQILNEDNVTKVAKKTYLEYLKNPKSLDAKIRKQNDLDKQLDDLRKKYFKAKGRLSDKELLKYFRKAVKISREWWHRGVIGEDKGRVIDFEVVPKIAKNHNLDSIKTREVVSTLSHPDKQTVLNLERVSILNICLEILRKKLFSKIDKIDLNRYPDLRNKIKKYINEYFWTKTDFYGREVIDEKKVLEMAKNILTEKDKKEIKTELMNINENIKKIKKEKERILKNIKFSSQDKKELTFARKTVYWIDVRKLQMMKQFYFFFDMINEIAKRRKLNYDEISVYTVAELDDLLKNNQKLNNQEYKKRMTNYFVVYKYGQEAQFFYGKDGREIFETISHTEEEEIRGTVASVGKIGKIFTGIARIVLDPSKDEFGEGEVLVTSMTRVEFVPLMRRARAIITNEGGMACHAAIVSRELGIPAIIGTKIATKVLHDGDIIEVDAEKGVVRILKKT